MEKEIICFRGERSKWIDFVSKLKKERKEVWEVIKPLIEDYLKKNNCLEGACNTNKAEN